MSPASILFVPLDLSPNLRKGIWDCESRMPSWNGGAAEQAINSFAKATIDIGSAQFVIPEDRIATLTKTVRCGLATNSADTDGTKKLLN
jgi:hypothetical protein